MLAAAAALMAAVLGLWAWLELVGPLPGERQVLDWQLSHNRFDLDIVPALTVLEDLASPIVAAVLIAGLTAVVLEARGRCVAVLVPLAAGAAVLTTVLKAIFGPTPLWASAKDQANYPSGHTAFATAVAVLLAGLCWQAGRPVAAVLVAGIAVAMGPAMVIGGWHLPSDVIAGYGVGLAWLLVLLAVAGPPRSAPA
jgi:membrane-associated phospholipid phosphatase